MAVHCDPKPLTMGTGCATYKMETLTLLPRCGDKSTQWKDIARAHEVAEEWLADKEKKGTS